MNSNMENKKLFKKKIMEILAMFLVGAMVIGITQPLKATNISEEKKKQQEMEEKVKEMQAAIKELEGLKGDAEKYVKAMDEKLAEVTKRVVEINEKIANKQAEIDEINVVLDEQQKDIDSQYESMKLRIRFMYENGQTEYMDMILGSKSIGDFLSKAEYISSITEYDRDMLQKMKDTKAQIDKTKESLVAEEKNLQSLLEDAEQEQASVEILRKEKQAQLEAMEAQINNSNDELTKQQKELQEQAALVAEIEAIERRRKEEEERRKKEEEERRQQALQNGQTVDDNKNDVPSYSGGGFVWPTPGYYTITSDYGNRNNPFDTSSPEFHKGIDIGAPNGATIVSAADGIVAWSYLSSSAGNWVGIDHGNGVYTVYMHMSYSIVREGQKVSAGQTIGYVGTTGNSTGYHLHFAVRKNGSYVNPNNYF